MAFLNGKYTAFDPQITLADVQDDDNTCVVTAESVTFDTENETLEFSDLDKSVFDVADAQASGKRIVVILPNV